MKWNWRIPALCVSAVFLTVLLMGGCNTQVDSFYDPAKTGRFEFQSGYAPSTRGHTPADPQLFAFTSELPFEPKHLRAAMPEGALPALDEEVWVIVKHEPDDSAPPQEDSDIPGSGAMMCRISDDTYSDDIASPAPPSREMPLSLKHTEVRANINAYIASVDVTQQFVNPYSSKIEALYVFPLPENAAITGFIMTIGDRKIRGILREREQAEQIYYEARSQGYVASLLTQQRANVFTQAVANIEPGRDVDVHITYFHTLRYDDGWYEYVFPMVVGPRFNPPCTYEGIGAAPSGQIARTGQPTNVHYLNPGAGSRTGHDINISVSIDAAVPIEDIRCSSHDVDITGRASSRAEARLAAHDTIPNKDFVLRYRVAGDQVQTGFLTTVTEQGGFFTLMLYPPHSSQQLRRAPLELVFVVDCSGSMKGEPIRLACQAVRRALAQLQPDDTFQVIRFSNEASHFGRTPVPANRQNIDAGLRYVENLRADGGTMMIEGVRAALDFPHDRYRLRYVVFLTDGFIGNEREVLETIDDRLGDSHIFSFGIGSSPNRALLDSMAKFGRGAVASIGLRDISADVMDDFLHRIAHPVMSDITIDWGGLAVQDVVPRRIPALFVGRPIVVTGRFNPQQSAQTANVRIRGNVAGERVEAVVRTPFYENHQNRALAAVWARAMMADMMDREIVRPSNTLTARLRRHALDFGLMSPYTAFIAVDSSRVTAGSSGTRVPVGVPVPEGVRYDTTVHR